VRVESDAGRPSGALDEAYAAAGRTDDAIATATEALDLARQVNAPGLAEEFERKLNRYRASLSPG